MSSRTHDQPGLEVVPYDLGLEAVHPTTEYPVKTEASVFISEPRKELRAGPCGKRWRRKRWIWLGIVIFLVTAGAAIAGGVVGSRKKDNNSSAEKGGNTSSATLIRSGSALAATGWRMGDISHVQLFYQGKDSFVYYSGWNSSSKNWAAPVKLSIGAARNTAIAASLIFLLRANEDQDSSPQVEFFYRNTSNVIAGANFQPTFPNGLADSIQDYRFNISETSRLAAFWPVIVYQDRSSQMNMIWYNPNTTKYDADARPLSSDSVIASDNSPMVVLPLQKNHPTYSNTIAPDVKLFYRRDDGNLYEFNLWPNGTVAKNEAIEGFSISRNSSLAGFSTARSSQDSTALNTYILYQADNGTILWGSNTDSSGWHGPKIDEVFDGLTTQRIWRVLPPRLVQILIFH